MRYKYRKHGSLIKEIALKPCNGEELRLLRALYDVFANGGRIEITPNQGDCSITECYKVQYVGTIS